MNEHYFSAQPSGEANTKVLHVVLGGRQVQVSTASGVFSGDGVDRGTAVLLAQTEPVAHGDILDLGCGWGPIAIDTALLSPATTVWAVDVNERAISLCRENTQALGLTNVRTLPTTEIPDEIEFTQIRSNPPIRVGKAVLHELMHTWLPRLASGGICDMVVAKQLGAISFEKWLRDTFASTHTVERLARDKGFHILRVTKL